MLAPQGCLGNVQCLTQGVQWFVKVFLVIDVENEMGVATTVQSPWDVLLP